MREKTMTRRKVFFPAVIVGLGLVWALKLLWLWRMPMPPDRVYVFRPLAMAAVVAVGVIFIAFMIRIMRDID